MTARNPSGHQDDALEQWLDGHQSALVDALDDILDVEAGLREVLLQSQHAVIVDDLDTILDVESGLAAILPVPSSSIVQPESHTQGRDYVGKEQLLQLISPEERLELRLNSQVMAASISLETARKIVAHLQLSRACVHSLTSTLDHLNDSSSSDIIIRLQDFSLALTRTLANALELSYNIDLIEARAQDFAYDLVKAHEDSQSITRHIIITEGDNASIRNSDLSAASRKILDLRDILSRIRDQALLDFGVTQIRQAIIMTLGRDLPDLTEESVKMFLDDFTRADLRAAKLIGITLEGVRWSENGTLWPEEIDVEDLKLRSKETPAGSRIYVVQSGSATIRDFVDFA